MDHLVAIVQLRMSNKVGSKIPKSIIKGYIDTILLSIVDLAKDEIPLVLTGLLKAESYTTIGGAKSVRLKLSKSIRPLIEKSVLFDDSTLRSLDQIAIDNRVTKFRSSLEEQILDREKVVKKFDIFSNKISSKVLTHDVSNATINSVKSSNNENLSISDVSKGGDSNEIAIVKQSEDEEVLSMVLDSDEDWDFDSIM